MNPNQSRQSFLTGLIPNAWVCVLASQEPNPSPTEKTVRNEHHGIGVLVEADVANTADTILMLQQSDDGATWEEIATSAALVPGGNSAFGDIHSKARVRLLAYSTGTGLIRCVLAKPESQASPDYVQSELACAVLCECACETNSETGE